MINQEIHEFLQNPVDYDHGVFLYSKVAKNQRLIQYLTFKRTRKTESKLIYELDKYLKFHPYEDKDIQQNEEKKRSEGSEEAKASRSCASNQGEERKANANSATGQSLYGHRSALRNDESQGIHSTHRSHRSSSDSNDVLLTRVKDKRITLYRERGHLHGRLHESPSDKDRYEIAKSIMLIQKKIDSINEDLDLVKENKIPKGFFQEYLSAAEYKQMQNYKRYISRHKRTAKEASDKQKKQDALDKVQEYEDKLKQLLNYAKYQEI